jgi:signal transduction histidine kinase
VEAHGGKIWTEKTSNGKGAVFVFTLPIKRIIVKNNYNIDALIIII